MRRDPLQAPRQPHGPTCGLPGPARQGTEHLAQIPAQPGPPGCAAREDPYPDRGLLPCARLLLRPAAWRPGTAPGRDDDEEPGVEAARGSAARDLAARDGLVLG